MKKGLVLLLLYAMLMFFLNYTLEAKPLKKSKINCGKNCNQIGRQKIKSNYSKYYNEYYKNVIRRSNDKLHYIPVATRHKKESRIYTPKFV